MVTKKIVDQTGFQEPMQGSTPLYRPSVAIHPYPTQEGLLVKVETPKEPPNKIPHVPCSIALVIDISGSMGASAPIPATDGAEAEHTGLSVLDLVKHAALTIVETLDDRDELGIVTFATRANELQRLVPMTPQNKATVKARICSMVPEDITNLWHGLLKGIEMVGNSSAKNIPSVMVLTDGLPNHMNPAQGFIPALKNQFNPEIGEDQERRKLVPTIHTFGFGYSLQSGLLKSIAEFGQGNYAFIPDSGMIGTVFVHAVANLQNTFAHQATVTLTYPSSVSLVETLGETVISTKPRQLTTGQCELTIPLGNLQHGQSRDIPLNLILRGDAAAAGAIVEAKLHYTLVDPYGSFATTHVVSLATPSPLSAAEFAFHQARGRVCSFLANLFPISSERQHGKHGEHGLCHKDKIPQSTLDELASILRDIDAQVASFTPVSSASDASYASSDNIATVDNDGEEKAEGRDPVVARVHDLRAIADDVRHQVALALECQPLKHWSRWGRHFLPSLHGAHARQLCLSFKDPGPLRYGMQAPLFKRCRDLLSKRFDTIELPPPPVESVKRTRGSRASSSGPTNVVHRPKVDMSRYNNRYGGCFAATTLVKLAPDGVDQGSSYDRDDVYRRHWSAKLGAIPIMWLRRGMAVATPGARGYARVAAVVRTPVRGMSMLVLPESRVVVTPWHPVRMTEGDRKGEEDWTFPANVEGARWIKYDGAVYTVLLEGDMDPDAHAMCLSNTCTSSEQVWGVTLGHGIVPGGSEAGDAEEIVGECKERVKKDVREHEFFGDYERVRNALEMVGTKANGVVETEGVARGDDGRIVGFRPKEEGEMKREGKKGWRRGVNVRIREKRVGAWCSSNVGVKVA